MAGPIDGGVEKSEAPPLAGGGDNFDRTALYEGARSLNAGDNQVAGTPPLAGGDGQLSFDTANLYASNSSFNFPSREELASKPLSELDSVTRANQTQLEHDVAGAKDNLPAAFGFHGGTQESQELWMGSQGQKVVPDSAKSGRMTDDTWVGAVTQKSEDPAALTADMGAAASTALGYARPGHISEPHTPGSVAVMDLTPFIGHGQDKLAPGGFFQTNSDKAGMPGVGIEGFPKADNAQSGMLSSAVLKRNFGQSFVGTIPYEKLAQYDPQHKEFGEGAEANARYTYQDALRRQILVSEALKLFRNRNQ